LFLTGINQIRKVQGCDKPTGEHLGFSFVEILEWGKGRGEDNPLSKLAHLKKRKLAIKIISLTISNYLLFSTDKNDLFAIGKKYYKIKFDEFLFNCLKKFKGSGIGKMKMNGILGG
jgi:hypothetical protein